MQIMNCLCTHYRGVSIEVGVEKLRSGLLNLTVSSIHLKGCLLTPTASMKSLCPELWIFCFNNRIGFQHRVENFVRL